MISNKKIGILLGVAQLIVFASSILCDTLFNKVVGSGNISDSLISISKNITQIRISILLGLVASLSIIILGALFYRVLSIQNNLACSPMNVFNRSNNSRNKQTWRLCSDTFKSKIR